MKQAVTIPELVKALPTIEEFPGHIQDITKVFGYADWQWHKLPSG